MTHFKAVEQSMTYFIGCPASCERCPRPRLECRKAGDSSRAGGPSPRRPFFRFLHGLENLGRDWSGYFAGVHFPILERGRPFTMSVLTAAMPTSSWQAG